MAQQEDMSLEEFSKSALAIQHQARTRWSSSEPYQSQLVSQYRDRHHYYNPLNQDQWPSDAVLRPGKIHTTTNLCKVAVDVDARLESLPPRITLPVSTLSPEDRIRAEGTEALMMQWLDLSGYEVWLHELAQVKSIYGKGVLKPYWDDDLKRADVTVVENPANLRLGWGSSDFARIDWAMYQYSLSPQEAEMRWDVKVEGNNSFDGAMRVNLSGSDHTDPLSQQDEEFGRNFYRDKSEYEKKHIQVWDYWYKHDDGMVCNATLLNGMVVDGPHERPELVDIPYIVIEHDHEPGSPEGISTIDPLMDLQDQFNRLLSHGLQHIADDVDPAWYLQGPSADTVMAGIVPKAGEVTGVGENTPGAWPKAVNTFPISEMLGELWNEFHRVSGLPEILFGQTPGADTSGRAIAIQVEAAANRLDPRRRRLYRGLKELLVFWTIMAERKDPKITLSDAKEATPESPAEDAKTVSIGTLVKGFRTWKIVAPEITPRDNFEVAQNQINLVNAKLSSLRSAMDQVGIEAPEAELQIISQEQSNIKLNAPAVQQEVSVYTILAQLDQMKMQNDQMRQQLAGTAQTEQQAPGSVLDPNAAAAQQQGAQQAAQPTGFEDQNQPITQAGSPPPQGAPPPGGGGPATLQALSRQNGDALNQIAFKSGGQ